MFGNECDVKETLHISHWIRYERQHHSVVESRYSAKGKGPVEGTVICAFTHHSYYCAAVEIFVYSTALRFTNSSNV